MDAQGRDQALDSPMCAACYNMDQMGYRLRVLFWYGVELISRGARK